MAENNSIDTNGAPGFSLPIPERNASGDMFIPSVATASLPPSIDNSSRATLKKREAFQIQKRSLTWAQAIADFFGWYSNPVANLEQQVPFAREALQEANEFLTQQDLSAMPPVSDFLDSAESKGYLRRHKQFKQQAVILKGQLDQLREFAAKTSPNQYDLTEVNQLQSDLEERITYLEQWVRVTERAARETEESIGRSDAYLGGLNAHIATHEKISLKRAELKTLKEIQAAEKNRSEAAGALLEKAAQYEGKIPAARETALAREVYIKVLQHLNLGEGAGFDEVLGKKLDLLGLKGDERTRIEEKIENWESRRTEDGTGLLEAITKQKKLSNKAHTRAAKLVELVANLRGRADATPLEFDGDLAGVDMDKIPSRIEELMKSIAELKKQTGDISSPLRAVPERAPIHTPMAERLAGLPTKEYARVFERAIEDLYISHIYGTGDGQAILDVYRAFDRDALVKLFVKQGYSRKRAIDQADRVIAQLKENAAYQAARADFEQALPKLFEAATGEQISLFSGQRARNVLQMKRILLFKDAQASPEVMRSLVHEVVGGSAIKRVRNRVNGFLPREEEVQDLIQAALEEEVFLISFVQEHMKEVAKSDARGIFKRRVLPAFERLNREFDRVEEALETHETMLALAEENISKLEQPLEGNSVAGVLRADGEAKKKLELAVSNREGLGRKVVELEILKDELESRLNTFPKKGDIANEVVEKMSMQLAGQLYMLNDWAKKVEAGKVARLGEVTKKAAQRKGVMEHIEIINEVFAKDEQLRAKHLKLLANREDAIGSERDTYSKYDQVLLGLYWSAGRDKLTPQQLMMTYRNNFGDRYQGPRDAEWRAAKAEFKALFGPMFEKSVRPHVDDPTMLMLWPKFQKKKDYRGFYDLLMGVDDSEEGKEQLRKIPAAHGERFFAEKEKLENAQRRANLTMPIEEVDRPRVIRRTKSTGNLFE